MYLKKTSTLSHQKSKNGKNLVIVESPAKAKLSRNF